MIETPTPQAATNAREHRRHHHPLHQQPPSAQNQRRRTSANPPRARDTNQPLFTVSISSRCPQFEFGWEDERKTHINHCSVLNLTPSTLSLNPATSCSILVSVSLIFNSCPLASSLIRPFSRFRSNLTLAWARPTSSRRREASLAMSLLRRSCEASVTVVSFESA